MFVRAASARKWPGSAYQSWAIAGASSLPLIFQPSISWKRNACCDHAIRLRILQNKRNQSLGETVQSTGSVLYGKVKNLFSRACRLSLSDTATNKTMTIDSTNNPPTNDGTSGVPRHEASPASNGNGRHYGSLESSTTDEEQGLSSKPRGHSARPGLSRTGAIRHIDSSDRAHRIGWRDYTPTSGGPSSWLRWMVIGYTDNTKYTDEETLERFESLAHMLYLLRQYESRFVTPDEGGPSDRQLILRDLTQRLYSAGAPIWVLGEVLTKVAEGLTGKAAVDFFLLPRRAFIYSPGNPPTTAMFRTERGYNINRMDLIEKVTVRLASFASNTQNVSSVQSKLPRPEELRRLAQEEQMSAYRRSSIDILEDKELLAEEILNMAADGAGLFFFTNSARESKQGEDALGNKPSDAFWIVHDSERELFSRLAALETTRSIAEADEEGSKALYPWWAISLFRFCSSGGACAFWYGGSWADCLVSGCLAVVVAFVSSTKLTRQERMLTEVVAGLFVGVVTGLIALAWNEHTCFGAMALGSVLDLMQGFRVVYSVIEIMSRHVITGGADLIEGIIFTALISYFLKFGQHLAALMMKEEEVQYLTCSSSISEWWYFLLVPIASVSWSGLFSPYYSDLPLMGMHGVIGYCVYFGMAKAQTDEYLSNFTAAFAVTLSAGIVSRFTGRQALGNTLAGLYVLLPGAYLVKALFTSENEEFVGPMIINAMVIGLGAWTGTLLCSPTLLGTTRGMLYHNQPQKKHKTGQGAMLYF